jgi:hemerythrin-like metal-binding protein
LVQWPSIGGVVNGDVRLGSQRYSVGVSDMDEHHKKLFDIVSRVHDAVRGNQAGGPPGGLIGELLDYTRYHFGEEETDAATDRLPPKLADHQAQHGNSSPTCKPSKRRPRAA